MKFLKSISLFFCMIGCLGGGIWLGAWGQRTFYPGSSEIRIEGTVHQSQQTESGKTAEKAEPLVTVAAMPERITADTVYLVKERFFVMILMILVLPTILLPLPK